MNKGTCEDKTTEITKSQGEKKMETRKQNLRNIYGTSWSAPKRHCRSSRR